MNKIKMTTKLVEKTTAMVFVVAIVMTVFVGAAVGATTATQKVNHSSGKIVFGSDRSGNNDIWIMNPDGSDKVQLTTDKGSDGAPVLSPDGSKIAWTSDRNGLKNLWVMDSDGNNKKQLTIFAGGSYNGVYYVTWSPDGTKLALTYTTSGLLYDNTLAIIDSDGTNLTTVPGMVHKAIAGLSWSPNDVLAFADETTHYNSGTFEIFTVNTDGTNLRQLTNDGKMDIDPDWSSDGSQIVWAESSGMWSGGGIWLMDADGTNQKKIVDEGMEVVEMPRFSPDDSKIAFVSRKSGNPDIWVMDRDGSNLVQVTTNIGADRYFDWGVSEVAANPKEKAINPTGWTHTGYDLNNTYYYPSPSEVAVTPSDTPFSPFWDSPNKGMILTGDINGDGVLEVVSGSEERVCAIDKDGNQLWSRNVATDSGISGAKVCSLDLADMDGDSTREVVVGVSPVNSYEKSQMKILFYDGEGNILKSITTIESGSLAVKCADLNNDGMKEVIAAITIGYALKPRGVYVYDFTTGNELWHYDIGPSVRFGPIADINNDGNLEFILGSFAPHNGNSEHGTDDGHSYVFAFDKDGNNLWTKHIGWDIVRSSVADLDNDGKVEIVSFRFQRSPWYPGPNDVYILDPANGNILDTYNGPSGKGWKGWAIADINGDGKKEIVAGNVDGKIRVLDHNLNLIDSCSLIGTVQAVNDINGDGKEEIIVCSDDKELVVLDNELNELYSYKLDANGNAIVSDLIPDGANEIIVSADKLYMFSGTVEKSDATVVTGIVETPSPAATPVSTPFSAFTPTPTPTPAPVLPISPEYLYAIPIALFLILLPLIFYIRGKRKKSAATPEMLPEQKPVIQKEITPPISEPITIERAIYDPCKLDFVEGRLPRMKDWIERHDPGAYWFAMSVQNNTDRAIEEWGIELETSSVLKIKEARVEGIDYKIEMYETHPEPYKNVYAIGVPKEYGIVIPKGGAQRVYFKLRAEKPKTTYEISGVFKSEITGDVPIRAKEFKYLCDTGVSPEAVKAELKKTFSEKDAARLALSFKTIQELDRMCNHDTKTEEYQDKLSVLKNYTEGFSAKFSTHVNEFSRFMKEEQMGYLDDKYKGKVRRFCTNLVDVWISEFLKG